MLEVDRGVAPKSRAMVTNPTAWRARTREPGNHPESSFPHRDAPAQEHDTLIDRMKGARKCFNAWAKHTAERQVPDMSADDMQAITSKASSEALATDWRLLEESVGVGASASTCARERVFICVFLCLSVSVSVSLFVCASLCLCASVSQSLCARACPGQKRRIAPMRDGLFEMST